MKINWDKIIAALEMFGGIFGIGISIIVARNISGTLMGNPILALIFAVFLVLYVLCFIAGLLLWRSRAAGISLSKLIQVLQIPQFVVGGVLYKFVAGLEITPVISYAANELNLGFSFYTGSLWDFSITPNGAPISIGINIVALIVLAYLLKKHPKGS